jgi:uncharacterized Zn finger protein (UPF0148 family)
MEIKVNCPKCKSILRVPVTAVGRVARCPACQTTFRIPSPREAIEDTVSNWIEEDVDHLKKEHETEWQRAAAEERERRLQEQRDRSARAAERLQELIKAEAQADAAAGQVMQEVEEGGAATAASATAPEPGPAVATKPPGFKSAPPFKAPVVVQAPEPRTAVAAPGETIYPASIDSPSPHPHLAIESCTQRGVRIMFDSRWLEHDGFSVSIPLRCAFTGDTDRQSLICKPLAFVDRSQAMVRNPLDIERGHEQRLGDRHPRQVRDAMGVLEHLPPPFNRAVPYYLSQTEAGQSLQCGTLRRPDGNVTCIVLIPDGVHALEWIARVNGTCGPEYELLERDVARLFTNQWRGISQRSRQRLAAWCEFGPGETFSYYFPDADFAKSDDGLAGVVITDRRAIYHKYHRHGEVAPCPEVRVVIRPDAEFAGVTFITPEGSIKAVRLHFEDVAKFTEAMRAIGFQLDIDTKV